MRTIFDPSEQQRILDRLAKLTPDTPRRWGRMSAPEMLCHLTDAITSSEAPSPPHRASGPLTWPPIKQLVIYVLPWPRGKLESPPDLLVSRPTAWDADVGRFRQALGAMAARGPAGMWPASDVFGPLTGRDWGALIRTHINHHFTQFGV